MARKIGVRTVTVIRAAKVDRLGDPPAGVPPEHDITGCAILPRSSKEEGKGWVVHEGLQVLAPYGADVTADDQVRANGTVYSVDGVPGDYENADGKGKATIFYLTRLG